MHLPIHQLITQAMTQFDNTLQSHTIASVLETSLSQKQRILESLGDALATDEITQEEFERKLKKEKQQITTEVETWQIITTAEVQKVVEQVFRVIDKALHSMISK